MNLAELFPYHSRAFESADGQTFHGWLAETNSANLPNLSGDYTGGGMNLWTQDAAAETPTEFIGATLTDMSTGTVYLITGASRCDDVDGGPSFWLLQVKESRSGR